MEQKYVLGFAFDTSCEKVGLIRKTKPAWQAGLLNGIGGKVEAGESQRQAMAREFFEETGCDTFPEKWRLFCTLSGEEMDESLFEVACFWAICDLSQLSTMTSEVVSIEETGVVAAGMTDSVPNLSWIVALARQCALGLRPPFNVRALYSRK